jgi:hypothetical protein
LRDHATRSKLRDADEGPMAAVRKDLEDETRKREEKDRELTGGAGVAATSDLKQKIINIFVERDVTFFDCFQNAYDPLAKSSSVITVAEFKKRIRQLNLPLTVQEHRLLRRLADPKQNGKVEIKSFCQRFETEDLRKKRLKRILDRVATAFFPQSSARAWPP